MNEKLIEVRKVLIGISAFRTSYAILFTPYSLLLALCTLLLASFLSAQTWDPDVRLTYSGVAAYNAFAVTNQDTIHIVWQDERDGNSEIYYKRSIDKGQTWVPGTRLTYNNDYSRHPSVVVFGSNVHVVWEDFRDGNAGIYYKRSLDNGVTWDADVQLTSLGSAECDPSIEVVENFNKER